MISKLKMSLVKTERIKEEDIEESFLLVVNFVYLMNIYEQIVILIYSVDDVETMDINLKIVILKCLIYVGNVIYIMIKILNVLI